MRSLRKFFGLAKPDQRLLITAMVLLARYSLEVRCRRKYPWNAMLILHVSGNRKTGSSLESIRWAVQTASRRIPGATCLVQSLAALKLLQKAGYSARVRIGAYIKDRRLSAHAWVETEGKALLLDTTGLPFIPFEPRPTN